MKNTEIQKDRIERGLLESLDFYRGLVLDSVEQELGGTEKWPYLRGRLLKALGDRGLAGRIREILNIELNKQEN